MLYLKALAVGTGAAIGSLTLLIALLLFLPVMVARFSGGSAGIGAVSVDLSGCVVVAIVMFVAGFLWTVWRGWRR